MAQTETVRDAASGRRNLDGLHPLLTYAKDNPVLDYPIIRCGDKSVVLVVDRGKLAEAYEDAARKAMDTGDHTAGPLAGVDAIIAKLGLREVEGSVEILEDSQRPARMGKEWVLLKPSPASKEGKR